MPLNSEIIDKLYVVNRKEAQADSIQERCIYDDENFFALVKAASEILGIIKFHLIPQLPQQKGPNHFSASPFLLHLHVSLSVQRISVI